MHHRLTPSLLCNLSLAFIIIEKTSLSGTSFPEEMFSTSEIELVETTIAVTNHSISSITLKDTTKILGVDHALNQNASSLCKKLCNDYYQIL